MTDKEAVEAAIRRRTGASERAWLSDLLIELRRERTQDDSGVRAADAIELLLAEIGRLRAVLRVNLLRHVTGVTHEQIDAMLDGKEGGA